MLVEDTGGNSIDDIRIFSLNSTVVRRVSCIHRSRFSDELNPFTSIRNSFLTLVDERLIESHLRSFLYLNSLNFSLFLSYQLGNRQMCAERFNWSKRFRSAADVIKNNARGPHKCDTRTFPLTTKHSNEDPNNTRRNWSMQIRKVRACVYVLQACSL